MNEQLPISARAGRPVVILCHPDPDSFNHSVADIYCAAVRASGQEIILRDLYAMGFDPVLRAFERPTVSDFKRSADVEQGIATIAGSDVFVLIYPIWFGSAPAMMKGYVERVLGAGVDPQAIQARDCSALLGGKRLLSFTTSAAKTLWLDEQGEVQSIRNIFDRYLAAAFGMHSQEHVHMGHITDQLSDRFAHQEFYDVEQQAKRTCADVTTMLRGSELSSVTVPFKT